ncbi:M14 family zinc carboxypeptidase [Gallaecimonas kandeliae]|uniref:M14 family zinc carboxypeptidase n=1 Tax=Gallaecimonas kandeliae TaxID=3029055 RepID=UPI002647E868|nr:M14 family zinc carboxypeptidase [Gallaecimonas kandeliae]WKE65870.1 M14 family zinc carboxypeptidase [Gallaecimonas kandeliae]
MKALLPLLLLPLAAQAQPTADYFPGETFDAARPTPESVLGFGIGDWHLRFDQQQQYLGALAQGSDRIKLISIGRTTELREQKLLAISSPANLARLEQIRKQHLEVLGGKAHPELPTIVWLGYSIHGDEPSGANAAPLVAYWLAASDSEAVKAILDNCIVLMDPALNPDGLDRYANFANNMQSRHNSDSLAHRSRWQGFPAGRLNHYGFDLNRDWLLLSQPASRNRVRFWQSWMPAVFGDFHEMETDGTFFFQPGIPSRVNPLTPKENQAITKELAKAVAKGLDKQGRLYFTGESFDDFYWGKASSYADAQGAVGILYEQARPRGQKAATPFGELSFAFSIENQLTASRRLLAGVVQDKQRLASYQAAFFKDARKLADDDRTKGILLKNPGDQARLDDLARVLTSHGIEVQLLAKDTKEGGQAFKAGSDLYVPLDQPQYRLVKSVFGTDTQFKDDSFYDVSAWNLAYAYNVPFQPSRNADLGGEPWHPLLPKLPPVEPAYAWAFHWNDSRAPALLADLLRAGIKVFRTGSESDNSGVELAAGDMLIPAGTQQPAYLLATLARLSQAHGVPLLGLDSGLSQSGADLGSPGLQRIHQPRAALLVGRDIGATKAGGVWQSLDVQAGVALTLLEDSVLAKLDLDEFSHLIIPSAAPLALDAAQSQRIRAWVERGGRLILMADAVPWAIDNGLLAATLVDDKARLARFPTEGLGYGDQGRHRAQTLIAGTQVLADLDVSHPLNAGLGSATLPLMRDQAVMLDKVEGDFSVLARYDAKPLLAGFMAKANQDFLAGTPATVAQHLGRGSVVAFLDDVSFRGVQRDSERWLSNALYLDF